VGCALCEIRKEKRFCPAVHGRICPQCCGEQREVTLDCPSDCVYLQQAREHEKPRRVQDLDQGALFLQVELPEQFLYDFEHLIAGLSFALATSARGNRGLTDADLIAALREAEQKHMGFTRLRDSDVLRALVFLLRTAHARTSRRPKSRAFIDFLFAQFPEKNSLIASPEAAASRIIRP
jgi:hypothetical protein